MSINLSEHPIGAAFLTRDGRRARLICADAVGDQPAIALVANASGRESVGKYDLDGRWAPGVESGHDLVALADPARTPAPVASERPAAGREAA